MRQALTRAASTLAVTLDGPTFWGWHGRTLSRRARTTCGRTVWLRLLAAPHDRAHGKLWDGNLTAQAAFGDLDGHRPQLLAHHDDCDATTTYRAEMSEHVPAPPCSIAPVLGHPLALPRPWWTNLRRALDTIATTPTERIAVRQEWIDRAIPASLGVPAFVPRAWETAHGDFHWANLTDHGPAILDWEGWGLAPRGYDAAMLHTYSLAQPAVATRVRQDLPILDTPDGLHAEAITVTELLQSLARGDNPTLKAPLLRRADELRAQLARQHA